MRLIDADKLMNYLQNHYNEVEALHRPNDSEYLCGIGTCLDSIDADSFDAPDTYPAWISVKDALPYTEDGDETVLVSIADVDSFPLEEVETAVYDRKSNAFYLSSHEYVSAVAFYWPEDGFYYFEEQDSHITHWMPKPKPAKQERKDKAK